MIDLGKDYERNLAAAEEQFLKPWTIHQLYEAMQRDLEQCHTAQERSCCKALGGREIREMAQYWEKQRKLTPGEIAIAEQFGYRRGA